MSVARAVLLATLLLPAVAGAAVTKKDFEVRTTRSLLNLCTAAAGDPLYEEAIHFCHGYLVGAYQYHAVSTAGPGGTPLVCFPEPPPSRDAAIARFVAWAQAHEQYMDERPVETEFRFLIETWPCKEGK